MLDSSSDSCGELVKWTSTPKMPDQFAEAPDNIYFRVKVKSKGQESICDILQRRVAKYGDDSGN